MHIVLIYSGGLDSTTLLYTLLASGHHVQALSINYGQRHARELQAAQEICAGKGVAWTVVSLTGLETILGDNALTNQQASVPEGHYAAPTMAATVVPNRNMLLLALGGAYAVSVGADAVAYAAHSGDHPIYPDCRPAFVEACAQTLALCAEKPLRLLTPYLGLTKAAIVSLGAEAGVPFERTWSCYVGGERQCGRCGTCVERAQAFAGAGVVDPTDYEDTVYWETVCGL